MDPVLQALLDKQQQIAASAPEGAESKDKDGSSSEVSTGCGSGGEETQTNSVSKSSITSLSSHDPGFQGMLLLDQP